MKLKSIILIKERLKRIATIRKEFKLKSLVLSDSNLT